MLSNCEIKNVFCVLHFCIKYVLFLLQNRNVSLLCTTFGTIFVLKTLFSGVSRHIFRFTNFFLSCFFFLRISRRRLLHTHFLPIYYIFSHTFDGYDF